jgi:micrococcal nuclease
MDKYQYHYRAIVQSVYDGDTCTVDIDLGLNAWIHNEKIRLYGINAPELRKDEREKGLKSRDFLRSIIDGKEVVIQTVRDKKGKYGRYLANIWYKDESENWVDVNIFMVESGHAVYKDY